MKAMVLAAGLGRRLRPLSVCWAKPTLPIVGRPLIGYTLALLGRTGIRDVVINLHHNPGSVRDAASRFARGLSLHFSEEANILGTAGGVKKVEPLLREGTFILLNGDTLADVDLTEMMEWHRHQGAEATLLLRPKPAGSDYTSIELDQDSRIVSMGGESASPLMFGGLWVLEPSVLDRIPAGRSCGLEVELLPSLFREGRAFGFVEDVAWFDIGTPRRYLSACLEMVRQGIFRDLWEAEVLSFFEDSSSDLVVAAGPGTTMESGARFTGDGVLGSNCEIQSSARIQRSVLWDRVVVGEGAVVRNSIVADDVCLAPGSHTENKIVLNAETVCRQFRAREVVGGHVIAEIKR
jgi:NDP-sugar pyrophosphorylase family protein